MRRPVVHKFKPGDLARLDRVDPEYLRRLGDGVQNGDLVRLMKPGRNPESWQLRHIRNNVRLKLPIRALYLRPLSPLEQLAATAGRDHD